MESNKDFFFECKSPGKIIISGEHAVVYNSKAIACAINLYTRCNLKAIHSNPNNLSKYINLHLINLDTDLQIEKDKFDLVEKYLTILKQGMKDGKLTLDEVFNINLLTFLGTYILVNNRKYR
jgi:mevalonate kinase